MGTGKIEKNNLFRDLFKIAKNYKKILILIMVLNLVVLIVFSIKSVKTNDNLSTDKEAFLKELSGNMKETEGEFNQNNISNVSSDLKKLERVNTDPNVMEEKVKQPLHSLENDYYKIEVIDMVESENTLDVKIKYSVKEAEGELENNYIFISPKYTTLISSEGYLQMIDFEGKGLVDVDLFWEENKDVWVNNLFEKVEELPLEGKLPIGVEFEGFLKFLKPKEIKEGFKIIITSTSSDYFIGLSENKIGFAWSVKNVAKDIKKAERFKEEFEIHNKAYLYENILDVPFKDETENSLNNSGIEEGTLGIIENDYHIIRITEVVESENTLDVKIKYSVKEIEGEIENNYIFISPIYTTLISSEGYLQMIYFEGKGLIDIDSFWENNKDTYITELFGVVKKEYFEEKIPADFEFEGWLKFQKPKDIEKDLKIYITSTSSNYFLKQGNKVGLLLRAGDIADDIKTPTHFMHIEGFEEINKLYLYENLLNL